MWCTISLVVIGVGLIAFFIRGEKNYDIDFTGGTMVSFQTTEPQKTDDVSAALKEQFKDEFTLERLTLGADSQEGIGNYFRLRSTEKDDHSPSDTEAAGKKSAEQRVRDMVYESFKDHPSIKLNMVTLDFSEISPVVIADGDESAQAISRMRFKGGSSSDLTFRDKKEVASGTVNDMLAAALGAIKNADGTNKYSVTEGLFGLEGTEGSGTTVGERSVRKFNKLTVRVSPDVAADDLKSALTSMQSTLASTPLFDEVNTFASAVASEMKESALIAILLSIVAISAYIWFRFQNVVFGLAAVVALVHDVLVSLGFVAMASWVSGTPIGDLFLIDDFRINLPMIAAFLTLVGYSLNDTIVMFDRIREVRGKNPAITVSMVNLSLNQTLGRTILTATTVFIVVFILYAFGGAGIHGFAWCLLVGCVAGTYSSIYIASPILIWALNKVQGTVKA